MNPTCPSLSVSHQDAVEACHRGFNQWFTNHLVHLTTQEDIYDNTRILHSVPKERVCSFVAENLLTNIFCYMSCDLN